MGGIIPDGGRLPDVAGQRSGGGRHGAGPRQPKSVEPASGFAKPIRLMLGTLAVQRSDNRVADPTRRSSDGDEPGTMDISGSTAVVRHHPPNSPAAGSKGSRHGTDVRPDRPRRSGCRRPGVRSDDRLRESCLAARGSHTVVHSIEPPPSLKGCGGSRFLGRDLPAPKQTVGSRLTCRSCSRVGHRRCRARRWTLAPCHVRR